MSDLTQSDFCPREHAIYTNFNYTKNTQFISTATYLTWQYGRYIEKEVRNTWLRDYVIGDWLCETCLQFTKFTLLKNVPLCECGHNDRTMYVEPVFSLPNFNVVGSPDFFIEHDKFGIVPIEIKTIDKDIFSELSKVQSEHEKRSCLYLKLIADSTPLYSINTDFMQVVYFCKGFGMKDTTVKTFNALDREYSPVKEFTVYRDDAHVEKYWRKLEMYKEVTEKNMYPARICDTIQCSRAKKCNVRELCFYQT
jgi:hypothetical protein